MTDLEPLSALGGTITGFQWRSDAEPPGALVVFLHGGGSSAGETLFPGHSSLELTVRNGRSAFAPNRPGYAGSALLDVPPTSESGFFEASALRLSEVIGELWSKFGAGSPGVFLHGESIGGAVALTLAAQWGQAAEAGEAPWPLLGVAVADIGLRSPDNIHGLWNSSPVVDVIDDIRALQRDLPLPPLWSLPQGVPDLPAPAVRAEMLEIVGGWPRSWREVAESITVPVRYRLAEHDVLWVADADTVDEFASALRTRSPYVDATLERGASHGIFAGPLGDAYNHGVQSFIAQCEAFAAFPQAIARVESE